MQISPNTSVNVQVGFGNADAASIRGCRDIINRYRDDLSTVCTDEGLEALQELIPRVDPLGWVAINGIYQPQWVRSMAARKPQSFRGQLAPTHPESPLYSLQRLYSELSSINCQNEVDTTSSAAEIIQTRSNRKRHNDQKDGHTILSNFQIHGRGEYQFWHAGSKQTVAIRPNQLVVIGGSSIDQTQTVDHRVRQFTPTLTRLRFMTFRYKAKKSEE